MEHRQRVEHDVLRAEIDDRGELVAIGQQVAMAQHDALGCTFRARGEQHDGRLIGARGIVERQWSVLGAWKPAGLLLGATLLAYALTAYLSLPAIFEAIAQMHNVPFARGELAEHATEVLTH